MAFLNELSPCLQAPTQLVFLDESGFNTAVTRLYARAPSQETEFIAKKFTCPVRL